MPIIAALCHRQCAKRIRPLPADAPEASSDATLRHRVRRHAGAAAPEPRSNGMSDNWYAGGASALSSGTGTGLRRAASRVERVIDDEAAPQHLVVAGLVPATPTSFGARKPQCGGIGIH